MDETITPLAVDFAPATADDWLSLVGKTLKGAGVETLRSLTADGLTIEPLYTAADAKIAAKFHPAPRGGDRAWDIRAVVAHPESGPANSQVLEHLNGGASSILLRVGSGGAALASAEDLGRVLDGVVLELATIAIDAGFVGPVAADWLATVAKAAPNALLAFHLDPLTAFATAGVSPGPIEAHLIASANLAARVAQPYPKASLFLASGKFLHEAGGPAAWELATALAASVAYAKALVRAGLSHSDAFARIVLGLAIDADAIASTVKLRAARVLWSKVTAACDVDVPAKIEARSSDRMLTCADPWTNLIRLTSAAFAGAVGGADAMALANFTDALGLPSPLARRLARNTQLVLMEEANVGAVADPSAGAWAIDAQTDELARAAWGHFTAIESAGGLVEALRERMLANAAEAGRTSLRAAIAAKAIRVLGVTDFPNASPTAPEIDSAAQPSASGPEPRLPGPDSHCPAMNPVRIEELAA